MQEERRAPLLLGRPLAAGATQRLPSGDPGAGSTAITDTNHGYAAFSVDGGPPEEPVSHHHPFRVGAQRVYLSPELGPGEHTLTAAVTGDGPAGSGDAIVTIDRAEVYPAP
ncbi:hypothetical protein [Nocardiopsis alborubida]|uniref:hypothetical protein n=1 Tax=Nocardiopsis alborubida TaxID=146802 RepID=UPI00076E3E8C|nr:hypothetical protein [Nocardiopsis alborubida]